MKGKIAPFSQYNYDAEEIRRRWGLERATKTLRGVTAAWIKDQRVKLENGQVAEYQVNMEVTFILEG